MSKLEPEQGVFMGSILSALYIVSLIVLAITSLSFAYTPEIRPNRYGFIMTQSYRVAASSSFVLITLLLAMHVEGHQFFFSTRPTEHLLYMIAAIGFIVSFRDIVKRQSFIDHRLPNGLYATIHGDLVSAYFWRDPSTNSIRRYYYLMSENVA